MTMSTMMAEVTRGEILLPVSGRELLFRPSGLDQIIAKIREEVLSHPSDISTESGRKHIASLARKVASSKVRLDDAGKELTNGIKQQALEIDLERKRMREQLDCLRDQVRRPLTEWENIEAARIEEHESLLRELNALSTPPMGSSAAEIGRRLDLVDSYSTRDWQEFSKRFEVGHLAATTALTRLWEQTSKHEAEQVELQRLRALEEERALKLRDDALREEAALSATRAAEAAAESTRALQERATRVAEDRARQAEEAAVESARRAERAVEEERQRVSAVKRREAAAQAKRETDRSHRVAIHSAAAQAIVKCGVTPEQAEAIVEAIAANFVPSVSITY